MDIFMGFLGYEGGGTRVTAHYFFERVKNEAECIF